MKSTPYNAEDAPKGKPGDPLFQYDCFGLGTGSGKRMLTKRPEWQAYNLAGGSGLLLDVEGNDHGSSAHYGVALFEDLHGEDHYVSSGPFYNAGVAWDHSVSVMIDVGSGNDRYAFALSTGLGGADHFGWGLFIDEGGDDQYQLKGGFGHASEQSLAGFFDLRGKDSYSLLQDPVAPTDQRPADGKVMLYPRGGLFVDR